MMKATTCAILLGLALWLPAPAFATITIDLDAELLKTSGGTAMPTSGLLILAASTLDSSFSAPTDTAFFMGDDIEIKRWDLSGGFNTAGVFSGSTGSLTLSGNWTAGDALQLFWFPTLTLSSTAPGAGTSYGQYRHATGLDGSAAWETPSDGSLVSLKFFTSDASFLISGGSNSSASGTASFTAVPEPAAYGLAAAVGCVAWALFWKRYR